jgi:hypothetical protein
MLDTDPRVAVAALQRFGTATMQAIGCDAAIAAEIADHLVDADLCGVYSHGVFRLDWYAERFAAGRFNPKAQPVLTQAEGGGALVDGGNNLGIPAFRLATDYMIEKAHANGMAAVGIANVDHTGRVGAFAQRGAEAGCLTIMFGGGSRKDWRQVAPYGGACGMNWGQWSVISPPASLQVAKSTPQKWLVAHCRKVFVLMRRVAPQRIQMTISMVGQFCPWAGPKGMAWLWWLSS